MEWYPNFEPCKFTDLNPQSQSLGSKLETWETRDWILITIVLTIESEPPEDWGFPHFFPPSTSILIINLIISYRIDINIYELH